MGEGGGVMIKKRRRGGSGPLCKGGMEGQCSHLGDTRYTWFVAHPYLMAHLRMCLEKMGPPRIAFSAKYLGKRKAFKNKTQARLSKNAGRVSNQLQALFFFDALGFFL